MLYGLLLMLFIFPSGVMASSFDMEVGINTPPPLSFAWEPELSVIPGSYDYVYIIPDVPNLYFHSGYWYRHYRGNWFRSTFYEGPWAFVYPSMVPVFVLTLPPVYPQYQSVSLLRITYCDLKRNWKNWGHTRHWHKYDWYRHGGRAQANVNDYRYNYSRSDNRVYYRDVPARIDRYNNHQVHERQAITPFNRPNPEIITPRNLGRDNHPVHGADQGHQRRTHKNSPL